jgi:beta-glucosidase/6-phospho-beta-glucosidase/beta-galactosidase
MAGLFESFYMGGFECATHKRRDRRQIDVIATTRHDVEAARDYCLLRDAGVRTVRDGLRWHLIERTPGVYDWSSFLPMLDASLATGTQVIWDLCHWGVPADIDIFSDAFADRFAAYAGAAARIIRDRSDAVPFYCAVNEISFWAWGGGDVETFHPHRTGNGDALKRQLVKATLAGIRAVRAVDPRARFVQAEPIINIVPASNEPIAIPDAARHTASQFEAWDMIRGDRAEELGGSPEMLDVIGVNYYWNNQWVHGGEKATLGNPYHKPLHVMLRELWERYGRPILITETGAEAGAGVGWLGYVSAEVRQAMREGVPMEGICLYPVMDYPGWDDDRHCHCGLIGIDDEWRERVLREDLAEEIAVQEAGMRAAAMHAELREPLKSDLVVDTEFQTTP